jgi:hypothetical protein
MGKGLALKFKQDFPENYRYYKHVCDNKMLVPGRILPFIEKGRTIFNFPTKYSWRDSSKYEYISDGLEALSMLIQVFQTSSLAIPAIGCGLGGLSWTIVKPMIISQLENVGSTIMIYEP